jgi:uncharacterized membrane protein YgcG
VVVVVLLPAALSMKCPVMGCKKEVTEVSLEPDAEKALLLEKLRDMQQQQAGGGRGRGGAGVAGVGAAAAGGGGRGGGRRGAGALVLDEEEM